MFGWCNIPAFANHPPIGAVCSLSQAVSSAKEFAPCAVLHYRDVTPVKWAYNKAHDVGVVPCRQAVPPRQKFIVSAASLHQAAPVFCVVRTAHYQLRSLKAPTPRCKPPEIKRRQLLAPKLPMRSLATGEADVVWAAESGAFVLRTSPPHSAQSTVLAM